MTVKKFQEYVSSFVHLYLILSIGGLLVIFYTYCYYGVLTTVSILTLHFCEPLFYSNLKIIKLVKVEAFDPFFIIPVLFVRICCCFLVLF